MTGKLVLLAGPTTVGKTSNTTNIISQSHRYTTREKRENEIDSRTYDGSQTTHGYFVDRQAFSSLQKKGVLVGLHEYANHMYAFDKEKIEKQLKEGNVYEQIIPTESIKELQEAFSGNIITKAYLTTLHDAVQRLQYRDKELTKARKDSVPLTTKEYIENIHLFDDLTFNFNTIDSAEYSNLFAQAIYQSGIAYYCDDKAKANKAFYLTNKLISEQEEWRQNIKTRMETVSVNGFHVDNEEAHGPPIYDLLTKAAELQFSYYFKYFSPKLEQFPLLKAQNTQLLPTFIAGTYLEDFDFQGWSNQAKEAAEINTAFFDSFNGERMRGYREIERTIDNIIETYPIQAIMKRNILKFLEGGETVEKAMYLHYNFKDIEDKFSKATTRAYRTAFQMSLHIKDEDFDPDNIGEVTINNLNKAERQKNAISLSEEQKTKFEKNFQEVKKMWLDSDEWREEYNVGRHEK